jgi:ATP-dependent RNA helicase DHX8/PRP22
MNTSGFYFNSARRVANSDCDYLLLGEGNIVNLDPQSVFSLMNKYPDYLIFTELGGTTIGIFFSFT